MGEGLDRAILNCSKITTALRWLRRSPYLSWQCSTQSAWKQCGARHARLNRVKCTVAERFAQSTSVWPKTLPRGSNGGRSPLGLSFSHIFLQTKKDMAVGDRWKSRATGKNVKSETPRRSDLMLQRGAFCFVVQYETKGRKRVYIKVKENLSD